MAETFAWCLAHFDCFLTFLAGIVVTLLARQVAYWRGWLDHPDALRQEVRQESRRCDHWFKTVQRDAHKLSRYENAIRRALLELGSVDLPEADLPAGEPKVDVQPIIRGLAAEAFERVRDRLLGQEGEPRL